MIRTCIQVILILLYLLIPTIGYSQNWQAIDNKIYISPSGFYVDSYHNQLYINGLLATNGYGDTLNGFGVYNGLYFIPTGQFQNYDAQGISIGGYKNVLYSSKVYGFDTIGVKFLGSYNPLNNQWNVIENSIYGPIYIFKEINEKLYISGNFLKCFDDSTFGFCIYDGVEWNSVLNYNRKPSDFGSFDDFEFYDDKLFVSGNFYVEPTLGNYITDLGYIENGVIYSIPLPPNYIEGNGTITEIEVYNNELYISWANILDGSSMGENIAIWNGSTYSSVSGGLDGFVNDMMVYNNSLYVCGNFNNAGSITASKIARWDGEYWHELTTDVFSDGFISFMKVYKDELFIMGNFSTINSDSIKKLAKYKHQLPGDENNLEVFINNPGEEIIIQFENSNEYALGVGIFTVSGQQVCSYLFPNQQGYVHQSIPIPGLASGVYIVTVIAGDKIVSKKLLKI